MRLDRAAYDHLLARGLDLPDARRLVKGALIGAVEVLDSVRDADSQGAIPGQRHWRIGRAWPPAQPIPIPGRLQLFRVDQALREAGQEVSPEPGFSQRLAAG